MGLRRTLLALSLATVTSGVVAGQAPAAVTLGQTFVPDQVCASNTFLQTGSPQNAYVAPTQGVITSWRIQGGPAVGVFARFKVGRASGGNNYAIVGQSPVQAVTPNALNSFADRLPVRAGDVIGLWVNANNCFRLGSGFTSAGTPGDIQPGPAMPFTPSSGGQFNVAAAVEPDADGDGFGDETQDGCPTQEQTQGGCVLPDTRIDGRPRNLIRRGRVIYEFSSSVPAATFECSLDGPFEPCTSPAIYRVRSGRHKFIVRSYDEQGVVDGSPAVDRFKSKRKRKRP